MAALIAAAGLLLVVSGAIKLVRPGPTATAARSARLGLQDYLTGSTAVRLLGALEVGTGLAVGAVSGWWAPVLMAVVYAGLGLVAIRMRSVAGNQSCGCFGTASAPVRLGHIVVCTAGVAVGTLGATLAPHAAVPAILSLGGLSVAALIAVITLAYLAYLATTDLPRLVLAIRRVEVPS